VARRRGIDAAQLGLAWVLSHPEVSAAISGPRTVSQLVSSTRAADFVLSTEDLAELDTIWPGLGGEAPEAYAW
jgi:aryl-alcohol dehydrogenase-like predicted oxidoreductase